MSWRRIPFPVWFGAAGFGLGLLAWSGIFYALALSIFFPALWYFAQSRSAAWAAAFGYYMGATQGLFNGAADFFGYGVLASAGIWSLAGLANGFLWLMLWHKTPKRRAGLLPVAVALSAVPPFGIAGVAHPLTASGVLYPTFGLFGLLSCFVVICCLPHFRTKTGIYVLLGCAGLGIFAHIRRHETRQVPGWSGIQTAFDNNAATVSFAEQFRQQQVMIAMANKRGGVVLFPESSAGTWSEATAQLWQHGLRHSDQVAFVGALVIEPFTERYHNALVAVTKDETRIVYRQRMPVPVSMWQPWTATGAIPHWFTDPVIDWRGTRVAVLICNEQFLVWTVVHSLLQKPDLILANGNQWSVRRTSLPRLQSSILRAWESLSQIPIIHSFNK